MSGAHTDLLGTARDLEASGVERPQAEAIARAIGCTEAQLATKADFERFAATMQANFERFQAEVKADIASLRAEMYRALWIQGAGFIAIVAALKYLP